MKEGQVKKGRQVQVRGRFHGNRLHQVKTNKQTEINRTQVREQSEGFIIIRGNENMAQKTDSGVVLDLSYRCVFLEVNKPKGQTSLRYFKVK